jgi:hypothetical protein
MRDIRRYWQEVRAIERTLPQWVSLVSLDSSPGEAAAVQVVEVPAAIAARLLHAKSHRFPSEQEIAAQRARNDADKRRHERDLLRRRGIAIVQA